MLQSPLLVDASGRNGGRRRRRAAATLARAPWCWPRPTTQDATAESATAETPAAENAAAPNPTTEASISTLPPTQPVLGPGQVLLVAVNPAQTRVELCGHGMAVDRTGGAVRGRNLTVKSAAMAAALLAEAFAEPPVVVLNRATPDQRQQLVANLFRLAIDPQVGVAHWHGFATASSAAIDAWGAALATPQLRRLQFAAAVASRHASDSAQPLPATDWIHNLPRFIAQKVRAHCVQHSTDCGGPLADPMTAA